MAVQVRVDIIAGNVRPLNSVLGVQEIQHSVVVGNHRHAKLRAYCAVAVLHAGAVVLGHCYADHAGGGGVVPDLADKSLVGQLVDVVVLALVVYGEIDEHQVRVLAEDIVVAAVNSDVGTGRADACVDIVHLCAGVLLLYPLSGERSVAVLVVGAGALCDGTA